MKDLDDYKGMLDGVNTFRLDDTIIMAYLCLNSTEKPVLGLKDLAFSEFGDWDLSIDQSKLEHYPIDEVCRYNAIDCMATMYLYDKYNELLVTEEQYELYDSYYRKTMPAMIKLKMTGLTLDKLKVDEAYDKLDEIVESAIIKLQDYPKVLELRALLNKEAMLKYNSTHKKQKSLEEFNEAFNPSSTSHKRLLLFDIMGFKAEKQTKTGNDSTDKEVIVEFLGQSSGEDAEIIQLILDISQASIIRNNFLKAFRERSVVTPSGECKLFGDYKMFGTASGRLSSSSPNLQNLPSTGSIYAKTIKNCITAPEGFIVGTLDYASLEDRLMASLANCKAKLKEYSDNLDGHSFRAANYFKDELEARGIFINLEDTESVNSIKKLAPDLRQDSKAPTFAMAYGSGARPIMNALKCSKAKAEEILQAYKDIYPELEEFSQETLEFAKEHGYVIGFYGLKLRCPSINSSDPEVVAHTLRTIVNMRIQSGAMLTVGAIADFQSYTESLGIAENIRPHATIHDSVYYYIKEDPSLVKEVNTKLVELMVRPYPNQIVANEAELDIGRDWAHLEKGAVGKHTETKDYLEDTKVALENSLDLK